MKAIKYFLIFLTVGCSAQQWDSIKVAGNDVDSIMMGGVKIWEKPSEWDYEGIMTVGAIIEDNLPTSYYSQFGASGVIDNSVVSYDVGSLSPNMQDESPDLYMEFTIDHIYDYVNPVLNRNYISFSLQGNAGSLLTTDDVTLQIDGIDYVLTYDIFYEEHRLDNDNPFPDEGETCSIKIKYTLAP